MKFKNKTTLLKYYLLGLCLSLSACGVAQNVASQVRGSGLSPY